MKQALVVILAAFLSLVLSFPAAARTLAVFPLLDLTQDENGVNFSLTDYLSRKAVEHGFTVLPESEVMDFMVRHRIRNLGVLTSHQLNSLQQELKSDFVLLGTVCQLGQKPAAKISLSLQLIRTVDEAVVWSLIRDLHEDDLISLLGIADPQSLHDLYDRYFNTLLDTIPAEIKSGVETPPAVGILAFNLSKNYVKPGEKMQAETRVYFTNTDGKAPDFHLLVEGNEYPVEKDGDARLLKASWLAQEKDGRYPVDLVSIFPSGQRQVNRIGEYTVDGAVPELVVNFDGTSVDGEVYFNKELPILPRLKVPEALSRWSITVLDKDQEILLLQEGVGQVPPRIYWNGLISESEAADDGRYQIQVQVWDLAGNMGSVDGFVNLWRARPQLKLTVERTEADIHVQMDNGVQAPLAFWFVKVYETKGGMLTSQVGAKLPATLDFKLKNPESQEPLELIFAAQDRYGNRIWQKIDDILNLREKKVEKDFVPESQWLENF